MIICGLGGPVNGPRGYIFAGDRIDEGRGFGEGSGMDDRGGTDECEEEGERGGEVLC